jgi:RNA polymerase sigma-32 factor
VKIGTTAAQKKLFFNLRKIKGQIDAVDEGDLRPEQVAHIADKLGVTHDDVISMNRRMSGGEASLNAPMSRDADGGGEWQDWLVDEDAVSPEAKLAREDEYQMRMALLEKALAALNEREQHILTERRLKDSPSTLEELSRVYGVSRERVRQIEVRAFEKLQKAMKRLDKEARERPAPEPVGA